jgi:hypothetical protein
MSKASTSFLQKRSKKLLLIRTCGFETGYSKTNPLIPRANPVIPREGGGSTTSFSPYPLSAPPHPRTNPVIPAKAGIHDFLFPQHSPITIQNLNRITTETPR